MRATKNNSNDNTNSNNNNHYLKPRRTAAINEIKRRVLDKAQSSSEIMQALGLAERTYYRYLDMAFKDEYIEFDKLVTEQDLTFYLAVYAKRMAQAYDEITELSRDSSIDAKERDSRIEAIKARQSLAGRLLKIPSWIIQQHNEGQREGAPIALGKVNNKAQANNSETQEVTSASSSLNELEDDIDDDDDDDDDEEGEPEVFTGDLLNNDTIENSEEVKSTTTPGSI